MTSIAATERLPAVRPAGPWHLAWRRLRRDRVAVASGIFLVVLLFAVFPGAPLYERTIGHGPNEFFPYAVSTSLRPVGPFTRVWDTGILADDNPLALEHKDPPAGTGTTLLVLGADGRLGRDEALRLLYGGRVSLTVAVGAALLALTVGFLFGTLAGFFGGIVDSTISRFTDLVMAFPMLLFLVLIGSTVSGGLDSWTLHGLLNQGVLELFAGNRWHIAPPSGYCPFFGSGPDTSNAAFITASNPENAPTCGGPADWAYHLVLPWLTFALFFVALYLRMMRARMMEVLGEPYVRTARAKGASELVVVRRHALRNALSPIVTMIGMDAGMAIGIAMYVEAVFGLPALGRTTIGALNSPAGFDLPVILGVTLVTGLVIILLNLAVDLALLAIDPTIRSGRTHGALRAAHGPAT